jgi:hypothetical protein
VNVILAIALTLAVSAVTRVNAVIAGQHFSIPVLGLVAVIVILALAAVVLALARVLIRDGWRTVPGTA